MNYGSDDMRFTPRPLVRRKRGVMERDQGTEDASSRNSAASLAWQQAFKRLRVNDSDNHMEDENDEPPRMMNPSSEGRLQRREAHLYSTPPPKPPVVHPPPDTDYKRSNFLLGQLHRERCLRDQEDTRHLFQMSSVQRSFYKSEDDDRGLQFESPLHQQQMDAIQLFGTPPMRNRKMIQLHTDSKLG